MRLLDRSSGQRKASTGTLYLSATHTIFVENNPETRKETWVSWSHEAVPVSHEYHLQHLIHATVKVNDIIIKAEVGNLGMRLGNQSNI